MNLTSESSLTRLDDINLDEPVNEGDEISIFVESVSDSHAPKAALIAFHFEDSRGTVLEVPTWRWISKSEGTFAYLSAPNESGIAHDRFDLLVPNGAVRLRLYAKQWLKSVSTSIVGDIQVQNPATGHVVVSYPSGKPVPTSSGKFAQRISLEGLENRLTLETHYIPGPKPNSIAPLSVKFLDVNDSELLGNTDLPQNPKFGSFIGLPPGPQEELHFETNITVPPEAHTLEIRGVDWGEACAEIQRPFSVLGAGESYFNIRDFIKGVATDRPLLIIDTTAPPLGHETLALRPNNLAAAYERLGWTVVFVPFGGLQDYPASISENLVQIPREDFDALIKACLEYRGGAENVFVCSSFPSIQGITAMQRLSMAGWKTVYECRDDMEEFNRVGYSKWYDPQLERQVLRLADRVVSVSPALDEKLVSLYPALEFHSVVPNAVNRSVIESASELRNEDVRKTRNQSNIVGYVGHLTESWFDWPAVIKVASQLPEYIFEIVGHGMPKNLRLPGNVVYLGPKSHEELKSVVSKWKVGIIPFLDIPLTRSVDPNKIYEYFAWGLRCVSAPMGMVDKYPSTWVYRGIGEFAEYLRSAMDTEITADELAILEEFLSTSSWDDRAKTMLGEFGVIEREGR